MPWSGIGSVGRRGRGSGSLLIESHARHDPLVMRPPAMANRCVECASFSAQMDDIDQQIVALLRENARRSFQDIGGHVSLSAPGGQAAGRPARGRRGHPGLRRGRRSGRVRLAHARVRRPLLRGADGAGEIRSAVVERTPRSSRPTPSPARQRDPPRARAGHRAPRGRARAHPRHAGHHAHADPGRAVDALRAPRHMIRQVLVPCASRRPSASVSRASAVATRPPRWMTDPVATTGPVSWVIART